MTSELTDDDWLSSGSLSNRFLSTSVWNVGSFSTRSPPSASTVTAVVDPATASFTDTFTGTEDRGSTSCAYIVKPAAVTVR